MTRIPHKSGEVPSWSWMAYTGGIEFIEDEYGDLDVFQNLKFDEEDRKALTTDLWEFVDCHLKGEEEESGATSRKMLISLSGMEIGWIQYDVKDGQDLPLDGSAVVGRSKAKGRLDPQNCHILILRHRVKNKYERVGFGMVQEGYVSRQRPSVRSVRIV
jgi:hypothetical protein